MENYGSKSDKLKGEGIKIMNWNIAMSSLKMTVKRMAF